MRPDDVIRLRHMLDAASEAREFVAYNSRNDLDTDRKLTLSLVKSIEIIGEAASKVSDDTRKFSPSIPWQDITAMRNRLIHAYFDINLDVVWDTVTEELPSLIDALKEALAGE